MTTNQAAHILGCSAHHVSVLIRAGELRAANIGAGLKRPTWSVDPASIRDFLVRRAYQPPGVIVHHPKPRAIPQVLTFRPEPSATPRPHAVHGHTPEPSCHSTHD
jgi:excisionase family DNA binding protein